MCVCVCVSYVCASACRMPHFSHWQTPFGIMGKKRRTTRTVRRFRSTPSTLGEIGINRTRRQNCHRAHHNRQPVNGSVNGTIMHARQYIIMDSFFGECSGWSGVERGARGGRERVEKNERSEQVPFVTNTTLPVASLSGTNTNWFHCRIRTRYCSTSCCKLSHEFITIIFFRIIIVSGRYFT